MYYYRKAGKQIVDLRGNLILSHNSDLVKCRVKSSAPGGVQNPKYIMVSKLGFISKIKATYYATRFIWGKSEALNSNKEGL